MPTANGTEAHDHGVHDRRPHRDVVRDGTPPWPAALPFAATLLLAPQLMGGVFGWAMTTIAGLVAATALSTWWLHRKRDLHALAPAAVGFAGLVLYTAVTALPLPCAVVEGLNPTAARHAREVAEILSAPPRCTLSEDPGNTWNEVLKLAAVALTFLSASVLCRAGHRRFVVGSAAASGALMALVALAHAALGLDAVFGQYTPKYVETRFLTAPLMNENQLGGFLSMALPMTLGLATAEGKTLPRALWAFATFLIAVAAVLTLSRGTYASSLVGLAVLGGLSMRHRTRTKGAPLRREHRWILGAAGGALLAGAALGAWTAGDAVTHEVTDTRITKMRLALEGLELGLEHPWVGVGRGAFAAAFVAEKSEDKRFLYPENVVAQWTSEWGLLLGLALFGGLLRRTWTAARDTTSRPRIAAVAAVVAVLFHDLFDFTLELLGPAVVAGAILAVVVTRKERRRDSPVRLATEADARTPRPPPWEAVASVLLVAALLGLAPGAAGRDVEALRVRLERAFLEGDRHGFSAALRDAVAHHPAEPIFPLLAGAEAVRFRSPAAGRWLVRAMQLAPGWAAPHTEAAKALADTGRMDQALLELREAAARDLWHSKPTLCSVLGRTPTVASVRRAQPTGPHALAYLDLVASCPGLPDAVTSAVDRQILEAKKAPEARKHAARVREARRLLASKRSKDAVTLLAPHAQADTTDPDLQATYARALLASDDAEGAHRVLSRALREHPDSDALLRTHARVLAARGDAEGMRHAVEGLRGRSGIDGKRLAEVMVFLADLEESMGDRHRALTALEDAQTFAPTAERLARIATLAEALSLHVRAREAHRLLCRGAIDGKPLSKHCAEMERLGSPAP